MRRTAVSSSGGRAALSSSASPLPVAGDLGPAAREPRGDRVGGRLADRHQPLLVALAEHPHGAGVDVAAVEPARLADPQAASVQQLEQCPVAQAGGAVGPGRVEQPGQLRLAGRVGQAPLAARPGQLRGRIGGGPAGRVEPAVQRAQGGQRAGPGGRREAAGGEVGGVGAHVGARRASRASGRARPSQAAYVRRSAPYERSVAGEAPRARSPSRNQSTSVERHPAEFGAG